MTANIMNSNMSWYCVVIDGEPEGRSPYFRNENLLQNYIYCAEAKTFSA